MNNSYYTHLDFSPTELLDLMYQEASVEENYYLSPVDVWRCDVSEELRSKLSQLISVPFADCGFLKTKPKSRYPIHKDVYRLSALNLALFEPNSDFKSVSVGQAGIYTVEYKKDYFLLLNVLEYHGVKNNSENEDRIVLSIGFTETNYQELCHLYTQNKLFNAI
jgi:hypothetical protein